MRLVTTCISKKWWDVLSEEDVAEVLLIRNHFPVLMIFLECKYFCWTYQNHQYTKKKHIIDYFRYDNDLLIIYNKDTTNIENTLADFNYIHPNFQFTIEKETQNKLNYLDITITNLHNTLTFNIWVFRKPTSTDLIIHDSCHPQEHKNAAINYLINHMNTYPITVHRHK
jgi:hypothetical protein